MTVLLLVALGLAVSAPVAWFQWWLHVTGGPIVYGNARWRREAPLRAAEAERRELLGALTPADRAWLVERGWNPDT